MSFAGEYAKLRKKRLEEEEEKKSEKKTSPTKSTSKSSEKKSSFADEYNALRNERLVGKDGTVVEPAFSLTGFRKSPLAKEEVAVPVGSKKKNIFERIGAYSYGGLTPNGDGTYSYSEEKRKEALGDDYGRTWFQKSGLWDDGYQFGDVSKAIIAGTTDIGENLATGIIGMGEKFVDAMAYVGQFNYNPMYGPDGKYNKNWQKDREKVFKDTAEFISKDLYDERAVAKKLVTDPVEEMHGIDVQEASVFGDKSDSLVQSAGQLGVTTALSMAGVPYWAVTGITSFGGEVEQAYKEGATTVEAGVSGLITAGAEILTEKIGGVSFGGKTLTDAITKRLTTGISSKVTKTLLKFGLDAAAEGGEEILSGIMSAIGQKITYQEDKELNELFSSEDRWESFIGGFVLGGGSNVVGVAKSAITGVDAVTGLTKNEQKVVDQLYNEAIAEAEKSGEKLTLKEKEKLHDSIVEKMEKGEISTDMLEEMFGGETYKTFRDTVDKENAALKEISELYTGEELQQQIDDFMKNSESVKLKTKLSEEVSTLLKGDRLVESYNERARRGQKFEADLSQYDSKYHATIQNAINSGVMNNTRRSHELVDLIAKISADKGITFDFANNAKIKESGFAVEGKVVNGYVTDAGITLNVESQKYLNTTVGHEVAHVLEGTELYSDFRDLVFEYAKGKKIKNGRFDNEYMERLYDARQLYKDVEGYQGVAGFEKIKNEVAADLVGDYLFTDTDFIRNLSTNHRNVFQYIYDEVKYLCKVVTAGSAEAKKLLEVKKAFEDAYRAEKNTAKDGGVKHSLSRDEIGAIQNIGRKSVNSFDSNDIAATEKFARQYYEELGTKSPFYRAWFGDWRGNDQTEVNVVSKQGDTRTDHVNKDTGWTIRNSSKVHDEVKKHHSVKNREAVPYLPYIDEIIESAVLLDTEGVGKKKSENSLLMHYLYAVADIGNGPEVLKLTVEEMYNPGNKGTDKRAYSLQNIEKAFVAHGGVQGNSLSPRSNATNAVKTVADLFALVKQMDSNFSPADASKIVNADGTPKVMYHGSPAQFTVFDKKKAKSSGHYGRGFYFSDSSSHAGTYGNTYSVYLNIRNPLQDGGVTVSRDQVRRFLEAVAENEDYSIENYGTYNIDEVLDNIMGAETSVDAFKVIQDVSLTAVGDMVEAAELFNSVNDTDFDGIVVPTETVAFRPEQIKSATDNIGTFDKNNPDIRFSLSKPVEESRDLMALHNLRAEELIKSLDLGGLPMPSVAIIRATDSHEQYGDVSLILPKETIDPKANKDNKVYGGDAWTPTYPRIEYKPNEKAEKRIRDKYYELSKKVGSDAVRPLYSYVSELDRALNNAGGEAAMLQELYEDTRMMQVYLEDSGKGRVEPVVKETRTEATEAEKEMNQWFIDKLGEDVIRSFKAPAGVSPFAHRKAFMEKYGEQAEQAYRDLLVEKFDFTPEDVSGVLDDTDTKDLMRFLRDATNYLMNGGVTVKTETDYQATDAAIREAAADGYKEWVDGLFSGVEEKSGIRNNKEYYTPSGNPRSWDALHWENTLENVVKVMKGQDDTGTDSFNPFNNLFSKAHKQYGSIAEIKADSDRLGKIAEDEYEALKESFSSRFAAIASSIKDPAERNPFIATDNAAELIVDAVRTQKTRSGMLSYLQKWNSRATAQTVDDVIALVSDIANMPTGYFEAKPKRVVGFDEVGVFVIPNNADVKLKQELLNRGYAIAEYDPNIEGHRQQVVNQFEKYKFSLSNVGETPRAYGTYNVSGKEVMLAEEAPVLDVPVAKNATTTPAEVAPVIAPETEERNWRDIAKSIHEPEYADEMETDTYIDPETGEEYVTQSPIRTDDYYDYNREIENAVFDGALREVIRDVESGLSPEKLMQKSEAAYQEREQIHANKPYGKPYTEAESLLQQALYNQYSMYRAVAEDPSYVSELKKALENPEPSPVLTHTSEEDTETVAEKETVAPVKAEAIRPKPQKEPRMARATPEEQARAQILTEEPEVPKQKGKNWQKLKREALDPGTVFETLALKKGNRELQARYSSIKRADKMAQRFMAKGNGSLDSIRKTVEQSGKTKQFSEYMYHMLNTDRMTLEERYDDVENKPVFGYDVTAEMSKGIAAELEKANPEFKKWAQDVYSYMNTLRGMMVENGVISAETAQLWQEQYPHYVPIRRAGKDGMAVNVPLDTGRTGINAPIKKATGGNSDILPMFDTMGQRTIQTFKAVAKNRFGVELMHTLGKPVETEAAGLDEIIDSMDTHEELIKKGENGKSPTFTVFENGERVTFDITEEMYEAMQPAQGVSAFNSKALNKLNNIRRGLITEYNLMFTATNAIKDAQDVMINSQHPVKTYAAFPQAFKELLTGKGTYVTEYLDNGGEDLTYFDDQTKTFTGDKSTLRKVVGFPLDKISDLNNFIEKIPRLAEYIASRKDGRSIDVAMLDAARVTTDFSAGGHFVKMMNRNGFTFLNASVQGAVQQVRNIREAKYNGLKGWAQLAGKVVAAGLPAMLLNHLLWDDDEEYAELSDYVKQNYYIVGKFDDGKFVRIPKGRTMAVIQSAFQQMENLVTGNDEVDLAAFGQLVVNNLAPSNPLDNNLIAPLAQAIGNRTWYGEDLVPTRLQDLPSREQHDESTDSLSKWLGEKTGLSPYKINYVLDQYSGFVGDTLLPMLTPEAENGKDTFAGNMIAPWVDKFTTDSVFNNQNVSDFYDKKDELTITANGMNATDDDILASKYMNSVNAELGKLYAAKREIQNDTTLSDSEKYEAVRDIQSQIVELTKQSLDTYDDISYQEPHRGYDEDIAVVGGKYFKQNEEGEWAKMDGDAVLKYQITSSAGDSNYATDGVTSYYWYEPGEDSTAEAGWRKVTDEQLEKQKEVTKALGISAKEYWGNKDEYDFAYKYPENYAVSKAVGGYDAYRKYSGELYDIKADKDKNGKSISGSRKDKVVDYINGLDIDYYEKLILFKSEYTADDTYNYEIIEYLNGREDISYQDMVTILRKLGFTVDSRGNVTW